MSTGIDLHILTLPNRPVMRAIGSVMSAIEQSLIPVHLHVVPGIDGHIGASRHIGYTQGSSDWVMRVDDDDEIYPETLLEISRIIQMHPELDYITAYEECWMDGRLQRWKQHSHALECFRRDWLIDHRYFQHYSDEAQRRAKRIKNRYLIPKYLYTYHYTKRDRDIAELGLVRALNDFVYLKGA